MTVSSAAAVTSTTGAKSTVMPRPRIWLAAVQRELIDLVGRLVCASTRADGAGPMSDASRSTRPPSSSTLTASGSGPGVGVVGQRAVGQHRRSVQLPMKMPPTW